MRAVYELAVYVAISAGMALTTNCFSMIASLFGVVSYAALSLAIVLAGVFCILVSTSIAELASLFPSAPGLRTYLKAAFGDYVSLALVSLYLMMAAMIGAVQAYILSLVLSDMGFTVLPLIVGVVTLTAVVVLNLVGMQMPRAVQLIMTGLLVAGILVVAAFALSGPAPSPVPVPTVPAVGASDLQAFLTGISLAIFLFIGFEWVTPTGTGPHAYRWMIPLSMPIAIGLLVILYLAFSAAISASLDTAGVVNNLIPQMALGRATLGAVGYYLMAFLTLLAALASFNAGIMAASRMVYALSRERVLPAWCAWISMRSGAPLGAILLVGAILLTATVATIHTGKYMLVTVIAVAIECLVYGALIFATLRLRVLRSAEPRPFKSPLPPLAQGLIGLMLPALGLGALMSYTESPFSAWNGFFALVAGSLVAAMLMRVHHNRHKPATIAD
jgi:amino acid transporter